MDDHHHEVLPLHTAKVTHEFFTKRQGWQKNHFFEKNQ